ncbi:DsbA family protein [Georgenia sp. Z1491]|uniref:DsbA family protein n=1 Tax=Georgenia sp. Z1491 TaxID=3416707 RepID=UPI003CF34092
MAKNDRPTANERREAARERARKVKAEQARRARRNRILTIVAVVAGAALVVGVIGYIVWQGTRSPLDEYEGPVPENVEADGAIMVGQDGSAGSTTDGAPVIDVYADHTCSYCANFEEANGEGLQMLVSEGEAQAALRPVGLLDRSGDYSGYSGRGVEAMYVVADGAPELIFEANDALFDLWVGNLEVIQSTGQEPSDEEIIAALEGAGVPSEVASSITDDEYTEYVEAVTAQAVADGVEGTPTILIDGDEFTEGRYTPGGLYLEVTGNEQPAAETSSDAPAEAPSDESQSVAP